MIDIKKEGNMFVLIVEQKPPLKKLKLEFDRWEKLVFWIAQEEKRLCKDVKPKTGKELFKEG